MSFKDWINKYWTHPRDDEGDFGIRAFTHIWIGLLIGLTFPFSYPIHNAFLKYQRNEDAHTQDEAWKDIYGEIVGLCVAVPFVTVGWIIVLFLLF
jgi:Na+/proline symporter